MKCPYCGSTATKVVDKRDKSEEGVTRRRRQCLDCSKRFTTYERVENVDLSVRKKDGSLEQYDRKKLLKSMRKSLDVHKYSDEQICSVVDEIEMSLLNMDSTTIDSEDIGMQVLEALKKIDQLAYMRFASVYKDFQTIEDFERELSKLDKQLK